MFHKRFHSFVLLSLIVTLLSVPLSQAQFVGKVSSLKPTFDGPVIDITELQRTVPTEVQTSRSADDLGTDDTSQREHISPTLKDVRKIEGVPSSSLGASSAGATRSPADAVSLGLSWLKDTQLSNGSWTLSGETAYRDTQAVIETLAWVSETETTNWDLALDWYRLSFPNNFDYTARKIFALALNDEYTTDIADYFASQINADDLGFGYDQYYRSDTITTSLALKAFSESNYTDPDGSVKTLVSTLYNLLTSTNSDGGFGYTRGSSSEIYPTALAVDALLPYDDAVLTTDPPIDIGEKIDAALSYLKAKQNTDGSFGDTLYKTAFVYDLLLRHNEYPENNQATIDALINAQATDGSFNEFDFYSSALAIKALAKPDLTIGEIRISTSNPEIDTIVTVPMINNGYLTSEPFTLEVYLDGEKLGSFSIPYSLEYTATLELDIQFTGGFPPGTYDLGFVIIPSDTVAELNPNDNSRNTLATFSSYAGPFPPSWAGAATSGNPGRIAVTWLSNEDPDTAGYVIYIGLAPRDYVYVSNILPAHYIGAEFSGFTVDIPYYFSVVALDASSLRGDYSIESSAMARSVPDFTAQMYGKVTSDQVGVVSAKLTIHAFGDTILTDGQGNYGFTIYPGNYYFTASKSGYEDDSAGVTLPDNTATEVNFELQRIDDGVSPAAITGLTATPDNGAITLNWNSFTNTDGDFDHFNIYRRTTEITDVSGLTPIDDTITNSRTKSFIDATIQNGVTYYYAVTAVDIFGNENSSVADVGPVIGNSAPQIQNINAVQDSNGVVKISYDLSDVENSTLEISLEYFDGSLWRDAVTTTGEGSQQTGQGKTANWYAKTDFNDKFLTNAKIRLTADDKQSVNNRTRVESNTFTLDTLAPSVPVLNMVSSPTNVTPQVISGSKESNSSLWMNGKEIVPLDASTTWQYSFSLREGDNPFSLTSFDAFGNESGPLEANITLDTIPPARIQNLTAEPGATTITLHWDTLKDPDLTSFHIYRSKEAIQDLNSLSPYVTLNDPVETSFVDTNPFLHTSYYYAVTTVDAVSNEEKSAVEVVGPVKTSIKRTVEPRIPKDLKERWRQIIQGIFTR